VRNFLLISLVTLLGLTLIACVPAASTAADPVAIVKDYYAAINGKDLDKAVSLLADDAIATAPGGKLQGKAAIQKSLQENMDLNFRSEISNLRESNGEVRYDYIVYFGSNEIDRDTDGLTIVKNGQIVFDGLEQDKP
jgi:ketosteroid isomerase-like protein